MYIRINNISTNQEKMDVRAALLEIKADFTETDYSTEMVMTEEAEALLRNHAESKGLIPHEVDEFINKHLAKLTEKLVGDDSIISGDNISESFQEYLDAQVNYDVNWTLNGVITVKAGSEEEAEEIVSGMRQADIILNVAAELDNSGLDVGTVELSPDIDQ